MVVRKKDSVNVGKSWRSRIKVTGTPGKHFGDGHSCISRVLHPCGASSPVADTENHESHQPTKAGLDQKVNLPGSWECFPFQSERNMRRIYLAKGFLDEIAIL